jgi:glutamate-1-semialdehyde 2,1-aminomutase
MSQNQEIFQRLCEVIPGGVNSPVRTMSAVDVPTIVAAAGERDEMIDADGKRYIDYCGSWGPLIHGHCHPEIVSAARTVMERGSTFGMTTEIEERLARAVVERMPSIEKIRFVSSGTEATMSAVRLARGFTGRNKILKFAGNYHGHADLFLVQAGSGVTNLAGSTSAGVPDEVIRSTLCIPYNDLDLIRRVFAEHEIAAVIVEPVAGNMGVVPPIEGFLELLREETLRTGALLIFDEIITGFRLARGGAQHYFQVEPDLTTLGKIIGGGFPAAAFGGSAEIMDHLAPLGSVYQAGTLSGNPVAMAAGLKSLELLDRDGAYAELEAKTQIIVEPVKEALRDQPACIQQMGSLFTIFFGQERVRNFEEAKRVNQVLYAKFYQTMLGEGIYAPPSAHEAWFVSLAHTMEHLEKTRDAILAFMAKYSEVITS